MGDLLGEGRSSKFIVVHFGYLIREEHMNIAVLAWEHDKGPDTPVFMKFIDDWSHVQASFPRGASEELRHDVTQRLTAIKTYGDYQKVRDRMGPYTPFEFTDERASLATPESTLESMAKFFLAPYDRAV
jgi:hypothetical protein